MVAMSDAFQKWLAWLTPAGVKTRGGASNVAPLPASSAIGFIAVLLVARTGYYRMPCGAVLWLAATLGGVVSHQCPMSPKQKRRRYRCNSVGALCLAAFVWWVLSDSNTRPTD